MVAPAIYFYDVVLSLHIIGVVLAFGVTFAFPFMDMAARQGVISDLAALHRFQVFLTTRLIYPSMIVVLAAGFYMASDRDYMSEAWVTIPMVILFVIFGIAGVVFGPTQRKAAELAARDLENGGTPSPEYEAVARKLNIFGPIAGVLIMLAIFVMTTKPGA